MEDSAETPVMVDLHRVSHKTQEGEMGFEMFIIYSGKVEVLCLGHAFDITLDHLIFINI